MAGDGDGRMVLLGFDLLALDAGLVTRIREGVQEATGIPAGSVLVSCTHTHSGPRGLRPPDVDDPAYQPLRQTVVSTGVHAAADAFAAARPASLAVGRTTVSGVGANRRAPDGPVDNELVVTGFMDEGTSALLAVLGNYGCHPTVLGAASRLTSGDFFGLAARGLEAERFAPVVLMTNGGLGDVSTRYTRGGDGPSEAERFAQLLASSIRNISLMPVVAPVRLNVARDNVTLPVAVGRTPAVVGDPVAVGRLAEEREPARRRAAQDLLGEATGGEFRRSFPATLTFEIQMISLGPLSLVALPGEPFAELTLRLKALLDPPLAVVSVANGYLGYFPTAVAFSEGGYEVDMCLFGREIEEQIISTVQSLVSKEVM